MVEVLVALCISGLYILAIIFKKDQFFYHVWNFTMYIIVSLLIVCAKIDDELSVFVCVLSYNW